MSPKRESTTSRPVADLFELIGRRWTLRILWELRDRTLSFNDLRRTVGGMSQSVLVTRLTELFGAKLVEDVEGGYQLTDDGHDLLRRLAGMEEWALSWARER